MRIILLMVLGFFTCNCIADEYSEFRRKCRWTSEYCLKEWQEKQADERAAKYMEESRIRNAEAEERKKEERARSDARMAEIRKKSIEENEAKIEATRKMIEENQRREASAKARENEVRKRCGNDYRQPKIGMTVARAQECMGGIKMIGQINREDGVVTTYQGNGLFLHAMENRIVSWGKY